MEVNCCAGNRYCSVDGVDTIVCVCESDPVDKLDLKVVCQYCWFATMDAEKCPTGGKRTCFIGGIPTCMRYAWKRDTSSSNSMQPLRMHIQKRVFIPGHQ